MKELFEFLKPILGQLLAKIVAWAIDKWLRKTPNHEVQKHIVAGINKLVDRIEQKDSNIPFIVQNIRLNAPILAQRLIIEEDSAQSA